MPFPCAASRASAISMARSSTVSISTGLPAIRCLRVWPSSNSMAMKRPPVFLANFVDRTNVRMVQRGSGLCLALETGQSLRVFGYIIRQKFEGDKPAELQNPRLCRRHPSLRRPVSRRCGSARWSGRSWSRANVMAGSVGKSMKALELAVSQRGCCCNIAITLFDPVLTGNTGRTTWCRRRAIVVNRGFDVFWRV